MYFRKLNNHSSRTLTVPEDDLGGLDIDGEHVGPQLRFMALQYRQYGYTLLLYKMGQDFLDIQ